jgi:hypothetical protein
VSRLVTCYFSPASSKRCIMRGMSRKFVNSRFTIAGTRLFFRHGVCGVTRGVDVCAILANGSFSYGMLTRDLIVTSTN